MRSSGTPKSSWSNDGALATTLPTLFRGVVLLPRKSCATRLVENPFNRRQRHSFRNASMLNARLPSFSSVTRLRCRPRLKKLPSFSILWKRGQLLHRIALAARRNATQRHPLPPLPTLRPHLFFNLMLRVTLGLQFKDNAVRIHSLKVRPESKDFPLHKTELWGFDPKILFLLPASSNLKVQESPSPLGTQPAKPRINPLATASVCFEKCSTCAGTTYAAIEREAKSFTWWGQSRPRLSAQRS